MAGARGTAELDRRLYDKESPKNLLLQYESLVLAHKNAEENGHECTARMRKAKEFLRKYMTERWTNNTSFKLTQ